MADEIQQGGLTEPIDVILITHGRLMELTNPCVQALYAHTRNLFHLIVVDDSTPDMDEGKDRTPQFFKRLQIEHNNITFIHSDVPFRNGNQIFNLGLKHGNARFVATVMNSVQVEPDWDVVPVRMMSLNPQIGLIELKALKLGWGEKEDGQIECAGIGMNGWTPVDVGRDFPGHRLSHSCPIFSAQWAFALLRREAVVGNLDEELWNGFVGFDDIDNTLVIRSKGWEVWYCGLGAGYHRTHATRGGPEEEKLIKNMQNGEKFYKRWGYWDIFRAQKPYAPEYYPDGQIQFICKADEMPLTRTEPLAVNVEHGQPATA